MDNMQKKYSSGHAENIILFRKLGRLKMKFVSNFLDQLFLLIFHVFLFVFKFFLKYFLLFSEVKEE